MAGSTDSVAGKPAACGARRSLEYWAARIALATLAYTPAWLARRLAHLYALGLDLAIPRLRRTAYRNLSFALPGADHKAITDGVFRSIGRIFYSLARFPSITTDTVHEWIRYEGLEHFEAALKRGRGVLFATAHLGNWELSAHSHALMSTPMNVVVRPLDNARIDGLVKRLRTLSGNRVISKTDAARDILRLLTRNEAVGILIDQNASLHDGIFIDFFGVPACTGLAFAKIANRTGAAVIPGFALWSESEGKYILRFDPPISMSGDDAADTARIHQHFESIIRTYPDQWLWIHRRWKTRPEGEPPLY